MSILEGLQIAIFGIGVVFIALILLNFILKLQSLCFDKVLNNKNKITSNNNDIKKIENEKAKKIEEDLGYSQGELKLIGLDEKTAAMVMAIVSDESKIPLSKLKFKIIKELV